MIKSRSSIPSFLAAASVLLCVVSSAKAQEKVRLRMNLHPGQTFDQGFVDEVKMTQTPQNQRVDWITTTRVNTHNEVLNVDDDGDTKLKVTYQSGSMQTRFNRGNKSQTLYYDSQKTSKNSSAGANSLAPLMGQCFIVTISPRGEILKIEGIDALVQRMMAKDKSTVGRIDLEESLKENMVDQVKQFLGITVFSKTPVAVGESWTTANITKSMSLLKSTQSTLMSNENDIATLAVRSTRGASTKASSKLTPENPIHVSMSGTGKGVVRVDVKSGLIGSFELHQRMLGKVSIAMIRSTFNGKKSTTTVTNPKSWPIYIASTTRGWTVKLPQ